MKHQLIEEVFKDIEGHIEFQNSKDLRILRRPTMGEGCYIPGKSVGSNFAH